MEMLLLLVVLLLNLLWTSEALDEIPERARGGQAYKQFIQSSSSSVKENTFHSKIDNFDNDNNSTYLQRYFLNDEFYDYSNGGPVFLYIGGEGTLSSSSIMNGYIFTLAKQYNALLISLEHRYYGSSLPTDSTTDNLKKYLTVDQALADLNGFTNYVKSTIVSASKSKWFVFGGSYPGALASYYRISYPTQSVGSLSSSGVVFPIVDYTGFDESVSAAAGNECSDQIRKINSAFEKLASSKEGLSKAKEMFLCQEDMWIEDFFYMIADSWSMAVQYSQKSTLCDAILDKTKNPNDDETIMMIFANFSLNFWGADFCSAGFYNTASLSDPSRWDINSRSWRFQTCYEMSMFNTAPSTGSLRSKMVSLDYHLRQCYSIFKEDLEPYLGTAKINKKFGGDHPNGHNIFYSDFSDDPWQRASVTYPTSSDQPFHLTKCNDCGHCLDLHTPSESDNDELKQSRLDFENYLDKWLQN